MSVLNKLSDTQLETLMRLRNRDGSRDNALGLHCRLGTLYALNKKGYVAQIGDHRAFPKSSDWKITNAGIAYLNALHLEVADHAGY